MTEYENPWSYQGERFDEQTEGYVGFVYIITNEITGRKYVGQKKFWSPRVSMKKNPKTGKRKKTRTMVDSDWRKYYGSNEELKGDVASLGSENFKREIIHLCKSKGMMNYLELKEQVFNDVLLDDGWYNAYIGGRISRSHVK